MEMALLGILPHWTLSEFALHFALFQDGLRVIGNSPLKVNRSLMEAYDECELHLKELYEKKRHSSQSGRDQVVLESMDLMSQEHAGTLLTREQD